MGGGSEGNRWTHSCKLTSVWLHKNADMRTHTQTHTRRQTPLRSAAGWIWSLFKSLNYSWLKIHGEPFIWKLGAVQAALWCLIGLKVANPLNKSGRRVVAACVLRMRMWGFTTHLPFIPLSLCLSLSLSCSLSCFCVPENDCRTSEKLAETSR